MLSIQGPAHGGFCDRISRRNFLQIGGLAMGGLSLPQILQAESTSGQTNRHKGVIMVFLAGGPPHQDMWDLKPDAPSEIRGEFSPIETSVPGIEICELFPRMAKMMEKFAIIRSVVGADGAHYAFQCLTGRRQVNQPSGGWPSFGSAVSRLQGPVHPAVPAFVGLSPETAHRPWGDPGQAGFLGPAHAPFRPHGEGKEDMVLNGISLDRLQDRKAVLASLDTFRREVDATGMMDGMDAFTQQAFGVLTSSKLAEALDIEQEDPVLRDRYGRGTTQKQDDGPWALMDQFLVARRLIEAGVRCVTLAFGRWDWHGNNFGKSRQNFPMLDQGVTALVEDLQNRGMLDDVTVIVWGEFGRTPKINASAGRDHWPQVSTALLAGGGMQMGQVIGATNRLGEHAIDRPVHFQDIHATLYKALGIDVQRATVMDLQGRPRYLVDNDEYSAIKELF